MKGLLSYTIGNLIYRIEVQPVQTCHVLVSKMLNSRHF